MPNRTDNLKLELTPEEFELLNQSFKKQIKKIKKKYNNKDAIFIPVNNLKYKLKTANKKYKRQELICKSPTTYQIQLNTVEGTHVYQTKNHRVIYRIQTIFKQDFNTPTHINGAKLGTSLAWLTHLISDNQSYYNSDNIVGNMDDWLQNSHTTWHALETESKDGNYHYASILNHLIDDVNDAKYLARSSFDMHDKLISNQEYYDILEFQQNYLLMHINEPETNIQISEA